MHPSNEDVIKALWKVSTPIPVVTGPEVFDNLPHGLGIWRTRQGQYPQVFQVTRTTRDLSADGWKYGSAVLENIRRAAELTKHIDAVFADIDERERALHGLPAAEGEGGRRVVSLPEPAFPVKPA